MGYFSVPVFPLLLWAIKTGIKHFPLNLREVHVFFPLYPFPQEGGLCRAGGFAG